MSFIRHFAVIAISLAAVGGIFVEAQQQKAPPPLPYTTIDHPEFVPASRATFLSGNDTVIGVSSHGVTKAYPGADLAQHGVVQDQMPDGPIAVTW